MRGDEARNGRKRTEESELRNANWGMEGCELGSGGTRT